MYVNSSTALPFGEEPFVLGEIDVIELGFVRRWLTVDREALEFPAADNRIPVIRGGSGGKRAADDARREEDAQAESERNECDKGASRFVDAHGCRSLRVTSFIRRGIAELTCYARMSRTTRP